MSSAEQPKLVGFTSMELALLASVTFCEDGLTGPEKRVLRNVRSKLREANAYAVRCNLEAED